MLDNVSSVRVSRPSETARLFDRHHSPKPIRFHPCLDAFAASLARRPAFAEWPMAGSDRWPWRQGPRMYRGRWQGGLAGGCTSYSGAVVQWLFPRPRACHPPTPRTYSYAHARCKIKRPRVVVPLMRAALILVLPRKSMRVLFRSFICPLTRGKCMVWIDTFPGVNGG